MIDGGITEDTISDALIAGANIIVAGTSIFGKHRRAFMGISKIKENLKKLSAYIPLRGL